MLNYWNVSWSYYWNARNPSFYVCGVDKEADDRCKQSVYRKRVNGGQQIVRYVLSLSADIFLQKIRNIIFDTICYRFHSAYDSQFDEVLFDNQERAYIKTGAGLKGIPGIPEILDTWGFFTVFFNVWPRATKILRALCCVKLKLGS